MAADLPQLGDGRQHLGSAPAQPLLRHHMIHPLLQADHGRAVYLLLLGSHLGGKGFLQFVGQLGEHILFQAAHEERADFPPQIVGVVPVLIAAQEGVVAAQIPRQHKVEDAPQFARAVFHGRAGESKARLRPQLLHCHRAHAACVFDMLCLVQDHKAEGHVRHQLDVPADERIGGDQHVHILRVLHMLNLAGPLGPGAGQHHHAQLRGEAVDFTQPVVGQGGGRHHQRHLPRFPCGFQQGNHLHGFAQAHVVGQNAAHVQPVQGVQPLVAPLLVGAQGQPLGHAH